MLAAAARYAPALPGGPWQSGRRNPARHRSVAASRAAGSRCPVTTGMSCARLALGALIAFYGINGRRLVLTNDAPYDLVMQIATGQLDSVDDIAAILEKSTQPRP
jgi:hypothetical protein